MKRFATTLIVVGLCIGFLALFGLSAEQAHTQRQLRKTQTALLAEQAQLAAGQAQICRLADAQYRGQLTYTRFLAHEFHASPAQTSRGIADLKVVIGHHPPRCSP